MAVEKQASWYSRANQLKQEGVSMSRGEYLSVLSNTVSSSVVQSEKQKLIADLQKQHRECRALAIKYCGERVDCEARGNLAALSGDGKAADAFRQKYQESKKEMEIAASKMRIMEVCLGALSGGKTFLDVVAQEAEEVKTPNNYRLAKAWSVSRFWSGIGKQPLTGTVELLEKVKRFINPEYAAIFPVKTGSNKVNPLEHSLLSGTKEEKSKPRLGSVYHDIDKLQSPKSHASF